MRSSASRSFLRDSSSTRYTRAVLAVVGEKVRGEKALGTDYSWFVFPTPRNPQVHFVDYKTAWRTAAKKAGLNDRRIYDLRSTFASRADSCRATGLKVAQLLGHVSTQIFPTYVRRLDENTRAVISAMDAARNSRNRGQSSVQ